jgi:hypothetical protein
MREVNRVVIIADYLLKETVLSTILELGAKGYNVSTCFGNGQHEDLGNVLIGSGLIRVETLAPENVAQAIVDFVREPRWRGHALSAYVDTVEVDSRFTNV